jgi:hypothetical protein
VNTDTPLPHRVRPHPLENTMHQPITAAAEMRCPRRDELAGLAIGHAPGPDTWQDLAAALGADNIIGPTCSYCGSISPDTLLDKIRDGWIIEPTDKPTKAYLAKPYNAEELAHAKFHSTGWQKAYQAVRGEGATENEAAFAADAWWDENESQEHRGRAVGKFYYGHLSGQQREEFVEQHNSQAMRLAYPGYFYVRPGFCTDAGNGRLAVRHG